MSRRLDYLVIGAGIVGLATARRLQVCAPRARIGLIEKESAVAVHQSGHNSGVIHAGVYYAPGSRKARYCRRGVASTMAFCREHGLAWQRCGKLIVATDAGERGGLRALAARAADNGLRCTLVDAEGIAAREPAVRGVEALLVPESGITDYSAVCAKLAELIAGAGGELVLGAEVRSIAERSDVVTVSTSLGEFEASRLLACGGLQADRLVRRAGLEPDFSIVPFRGDYYRLPASRARLVSTLIYPVPDPRLPFLGVHLTPTTDGGLTVGPTAMLALARERYAKWAVDGRDVSALLRSPGCWRLLARFPRAGLVELLHASSRRAYLAAARRYCPALEIQDLARHECGIRAQAVTARGEMIDDFHVMQTARSVHLCNAPSPAATSAFPIAEALAARVGAPPGPLGADRDLA